MKNLVTKEFDAKIAALDEEKQKKLRMIDELWIKGESSAEEIRRQILNGHIELIDQEGSEFDGIGDDKEKVN